MSNIDNSHIDHFWAGSHLFCFGTKFGIPTGICFFHQFASSFLHRRGGTLFRHFISPLFSYFRILPRCRSSAHRIFRTICAICAIRAIRAIRALYALRTFRIISTFRIVNTFRIGRTGFRGYFRIGFHVNFRICRTSGNTICLIGFWDSFYTICTIRSYFWSSVCFYFRSGFFRRAIWVMTGKKTHNSTVLVFLKNWGLTRRRQAVCAGAPRSAYAVPPLSRPAQK